MTKTELQTAIAEVTQTDKRTAGVLLDTLGALADKESKKNGEFVLLGFGKLVHRLISGRHTAVGALADFQGASDEHPLIRT
jgi:hypothetical protein